MFPSVRYIMHLSYSHVAMETNDGYFCTVRTIGPAAIGLLIIITAHLI